MGAEARSSPQSRFLGESLSSCGVWPAGSLVLYLGHFHSNQWDLFLGSLSRFKETGRVWMVFELEKGSLMGPPEILYFYFRSTLWPRDISTGVVHVEGQK